MSDTKVLPPVFLSGLLPDFTARLAAGSAAVRLQFGCFGCSLLGINAGLLRLLR